MTDVVEPTEITELDVEKVSAVAAPANGTSFLVIKGAAAPAVKARESQESDAMVEAVTGSPVSGATCNGPNADGSRCSREPMVGSARCKDHAGMAVTFKSTKGTTTMEATQVLKQLHPDISPERVGQMMEHAAAIKGQSQDRLNGTATPEASGSFASGVSGAVRPTTGGLMPGLSNESPNGLPGLSGPLQGGQSPYGIPAEAKINAGGGAPQGAGPSVLDLVRAGSLPGKPANPQLVKAARERPELAKATVAEIEAGQAVKTAEESGDPRQVQHANEELFLANRRAANIAQFGGGPRGGQR